jgi:hypothetical protein
MPDGNAARIDVEPIADPAEPAPTALGGLLSHPLTGWFSAAVLLTAAVEAGDRDAQLRWEPKDSTGAPSTPELWSRIPVGHLVELIFASPEWQDSQDRLLAHGIHPLSEKNQRLGPAGHARSLLQDEAAPRLLRGILSDLLPAADSGRLDMSIPAFANNSSYPAVALAQTLASEAERTRAIAEAIEALRSLNAGYGITKCDGGMERSPDQLPAVNGLGDAQDRQTRIRLAPLALFGMSRFGTGAPNGAGVASRKLRLPLPSTPASLEQIRAAVFMGRGPTSWDWREDSFAWEYVATQDAPTKYERTWTGRAEPRATSRRR